MRARLKISSDHLRKAQGDRRVQLRAGPAAEKIYFYGFACLPLLRIKIRVASFFRGDARYKQFSFANRMSIYRLAAPSLCRGD
jgi:hypothetical protein